MFLGEAERVRLPKILLLLSGEGWLGGASDFLGPIEEEDKGDRWRVAEPSSGDWLRVSLRDDELIWFRWWGCMGRDFELPWSFWGLGLNLGTDPPLCPWLPDPLSLRPLVLVIADTSGAVIRRWWRSMAIMSLYTAGRLLEHFMSTIFFSPCLSLRFLKCNHSCSPKQVRHFYCALFHIEGSQHESSIFSAQFRTNGSQNEGLSEPGSSIWYGKRMGRKSEPKTFNTNDQTGMVVNDHWSRPARVHLRSHPSIPRNGMSDRTMLCLFF